MGYQNTLFREILQMIPRHEFQKCVDAHQGDFRARTLKCWTQFSTLLFGQISGHSSLRSMVTALNTQSKYLYHLGLREVAKSTLSDANETRNPKILESVFYRLLNRTQRHAPGHGFRFKGKILALDSTTINLCLSLSPWAQFHHNKGAFKLHTAIDLAGDLPIFLVVKPGNVHDITVARNLYFQKGTNLIFDKAYIDFCWLNHLNENGTYFTTRMKKNCAYKVRRCFAKDPSKGICADQEIRLRGVSGSKYKGKIRRISYRDLETGKHYIFLTNRFDLAAKTVCDLYKARWKVELFFKTMKGQLQVHKFVGTSLNAVLWQTWTAMIAYLMVSLIRFLNKVKWSIPCTMAALAVSLFQKTDFKSIFRGCPRERCINIGLERQLLLQI